MDTVPMVDATPTTMVVYPFILPTQVRSPPFFGMQHQRLADQNLAFSARCVWRHRWIHSYFCIFLRVTFPCLGEVPMYISVDGCEITSW